MGKTKKKQNIWEKIAARRNLMGPARKRSEWGTYAEKAMDKVRKIRKEKKEIYK